MLHFRVFAKRICRSLAVPFLGRIPIPQQPSSKSHGINLFADSHPLNSVLSYRYKNVHGRGYLQLADLASFKIPSRIHPSFQSLAQCPSCNSFVFMVFHFHGGWGGSQDFKNEIIHSLSLIPNTLSPFFSHSCALFCTLQSLNSFVFNRFRTIAKKPPGVEGGFPDSDPCLCALCVSAFHFFDQHPNKPFFNCRLSTSPHLLASLHPYLLDSILFP